MEDIFNQIAKRHGVTAAEVKRDIEAAIEAAWESDNPKVRVFQKEIPAAGKKTNAGRNDSIFNRADNKRFGRRLNWGSKEK